MAYIAWIHACCAQQSVYLAFQGWYWVAQTLKCWGKRPYSDTCCRDIIALFSSYGLRCLQQHAPEQNGLYSSFMGFNRTIFIQHGGKKEQPKHVTFD